VLSWLKGKATEVSNSLKDEVKKIKNQSFLEGVVAGCTMVAYADGVVKPEEKQKMMGFMRNSDALSVFDSGDIIKLFDKFSSRFEFDRSIGEADALATIGKVKKNDAEARLLVRVCCAVGASDGNFDALEQEVARKICRELGLNPADFDLAKA
jgi:tellurite resistance protein TerB